MKLTDLKCKNAHPAARPYRVADGDGLHLLVTPRGSRLWRWKYWFDGKQKQMAFGKYPKISLLQARALHAKARAELAAGTDPMATRKQIKRQRKTTALQRKTIALQQNATQVRKQLFSRRAKLWFAWWLNEIALRYPEIFNSTTDSPLLANSADQLDLQMIQRIYEFGKPSNLRST